MSASPKQIALIDQLQSLGAAIPCHGDGDKPDFSMLDSVEAADKYIKAWIHLFKEASSTELYRHTGQFKPYRNGAKISDKQRNYIHHLHDAGAPVPRDEAGNDDNVRYESVSGADAFIKAWRHLLDEQAQPAMGEAWTVPYNC